MAKHTFLCRSCGATLAAPEELIGKVVTCSSCGASVTVPTPRQEAAYKEGLALRKEAEAEAARQEKEAERARKKTEAEEARRREEEKEERRKAEAEEARRRKEAERERREAETPANPRDATSFLNCMAVVLMLGGAIAVIAGFVVAENDSLPGFERTVARVTGVVIFVQAFWAAAVMVAFASMARNIFGIHKKLESVTQSVLGIQRIAQSTGPAKPAQE